MRKMANPPQKLFTNPEFEVHFAIVQVSCNPGWRTRENYIADVSATCEYYLLDKHGKGGAKEVVATDDAYGKVMGRERQIAPLVFSVLPLMDAQTLELQNSERRMTQLMADIAAAYPSAAANFRGRDLIQFVKQFQKDVATKTLSSESCKDGWTDVSVDLAPFAGKSVLVELVSVSGDNAFWASISVK